MKLSTQTSKLQKSSFKRELYALFFLFEMGGDILKYIEMIVSFLLLTVVPSFIVWAVCRYFYLNPFWINIITGMVQFSFGGYLIAKFEERKKGKEINGNS